ncbi:hypothetical protein [Flavobacterium sp. MMS24-S5]|uniref:hypothetical protein n=1 Tax=Flavobacterium sp. MMS24-S5 TaxID=3416605 RepID=UPI003D07690C
MLNKILKKIIYTSQKNSYWNLWIIIVPVIILGIYLYQKNISIEQGNYSIGLVTKKYWPIVSHQSIMYSYQKNNEQYISSAVYDDKYKPKEGERYLIQYSLKYSFGGAKIFQNIPVPDSVKDAPPEGWKQLPMWAKKSGHVSD